MQVLNDCAFVCTCRLIISDLFLECFLTLSDPMREMISRAGEVLSAGGLVALPTETVYGLGADARQDEAVKRIFQAKGRPSFNPLIVHVSGIKAALDIGVFDDVSLLLAEKLWPGPLTIVVPLKEGAGISEYVTAGQVTIALRVPHHPLSHALLEKSGLAIAAPSANSSGRISPTSAEHVRLDLGDRVDFILDGGPTERGLESTIVKVELSGNEPRLILLRPGPVTVAELATASGLEVLCPDVLIDDDGSRLTQEDDGPSVLSSALHVTPGSLLRHYAPKARVRLNVLDVIEGEGVLGFGAENELLPQAVPFYNLSETADLSEAAQRLFAGLHWMDAQGVSGIAVRPIPVEGVGLALNDRLKRAAAGSEK